MTTAVVARQHGDDYQARIFWLEACRLFSSYSKVARVGYEFKGIKTFDDVAVIYSTPIPDERGGTVTADFYQAKYHVDLKGSLTWEALIDPDAIGATSVSLLERLHDAATDNAANGARFNLISAWPIHPDNDLAELVSRRNGELRMEKLFDGTSDRSAKGKIRKAWRERLKLNSDDELKKIVTPFRIHAPYQSLDALRKELNFRLEFAGLKPVDDGHVGHYYDDLIRKLHGNGMHDFDRDSLRTCCEGEGLWLGHAAETSDRIPIGIRSFLRFAEHLEDQTAHLLCLLRYFDVRHIRNAASWQNDVGPQVKAFLSSNTGRSERYVLHLDAHSTIALLAGHVLDLKSGVDVALIQRGAGKTAIWEFNPVAPPSSPAVTSRLEAIHDGAPDVAVAISVSNEIDLEVIEYARKNLPTVGKVLAVTVSPGPGQLAVRDAAHAFQIAEAAVHLIRANRPAGGGTLHLFSSAPNTAMFFFGRMTAGLGRIQAYEYLFESGIPSAYVPSITLPV
ncbi:MAG: SAVED domain-containing protein [Planctomycetales bacterium]|nr:SAVED domain-containing protein [Planctomycetales bacterium]